MNGYWYIAIIGLSVTAVGIGTGWNIIIPTIPIMGIGILVTGFSVIFAYSVI